mgnify:CR=1 FL=1
MPTDSPAPASLPAGGRERRLQPSSRLAGLDLLACGVVLLDERGNLRFLNQAAVQLFELPLRLVEGAPFARQFSNGGIIDGLVEEACNNAFGQKRQDITLQRIGREPLAVHCVAVVLESELGALLLEFREIDQRIRMDREARMLESVKVNRELVRNLAHEIKNPLSGIRGAAQLLDSSASDEDRVLTQLIRDETDRIVKLVDRFEMFSEGRAQQMEPVNIHSVLDHVRNLARSGFARHIRIVEDYDPSLPPMLGSRDQMIQVLINLVKNAAEAIGPNAQDGEIQISTAYRTGVRMAVSGSTDRVRLPLEVCVRDNGPGIPEDIRPHLFDPFVTTKSSGNGLGLALVAKVVGEHGGIVECDSVPRRTVFRLLLPLQTGRESGTGTEEA